MCVIEYYTYDDYKQWKGDWELIWGQPVAMAPSPMITHQAIAFEIAYELKNNLQCDECLVVLEEDWIISNDTVVRPDVSLICNEEGDFITKAPKVVVEVVSKESARRDERIKFEIYEKEKVGYYVLAYPNLLKAKVYRLIDGKFEKVRDFSDEIAEIDGECSTKVDFKKVFRRFKRRK